VTYSAAIESAAALDTSPNLSDFAERVLHEANRRELFSPELRCKWLEIKAQKIWRRGRDSNPRYRC
jgi:hypothetical protein